MVSSNPATIRSVVVLPHPRWAEQRIEFARLDCQRDIMHRLKCAEFLRNIAQFEESDVIRDFICYPGRSIFCTPGTLGAYKNSEGPMKIMLLVMASQLS